MRVRNQLLLAACGALLITAYFVLKSDDERVTERADTGYSRTFPRSGTFPSFDTSPEPVEQPMPEYPRLAREAGLEGVVTVIVTIDVTGAVTDAEVVESPTPVFNESVLTAARMAKFHPAMFKGEPVPSRISMRYNFRLPSEERESGGGAPSAEGTLG